MKSLYRPRGIATALLFLSFVVTTNAQPLDKSEKLPASVMTKVNPANRQLVVLYFWSLHCKACLYSLSKIDSLQTLFKQDVQFVMIASQPETEVESFFSARKKFARPAGTLSMSGDTLLRKYFPFTTVPHSVWVSADGKVAAITSGSETNQGSINRYLRTGKADVTPKIKKVSYDWVTPILSSHFDPTAGVLQYYSYVLPSVDSFEQTTVRLRSNGSNQFNHIVVHNSKPVELCITAFNETMRKFAVNYGNVELQLRNNAKELEKTYLYDLLVPPSRSERLYEFMRQDIDRNFGLKGEVIRKSRKCLVLKIAGKGDSLQTKGGIQGSFPPKKAGDSMWRFQNYPFTSILHLVGFRIRAHGYELRDETGILRNVDMDLNGELVDSFDLEQFRKDMSVYGIIVEENQCTSDVLIIKDH